MDILTKLGITIECANQTLHLPKFDNTNNEVAGACFTISNTVVPPKTAITVEVIAPKSSRKIP